MKEKKGKKERKRIKIKGPHICYDDIDVGSQDLGN